LNLTVDITLDAYEYMWACIKAVTTEIGGVGYIERQDNGRLLWHRSLLIPQEVTSGSIDFTDPAFMVEQAHKDGVLGDPNFVWVWWHSHANMGVFWSGTDTGEYIEPFRKAGAPALVSFVGNRRNEWKMRLDIFDHALAPHVELHDISLRVEQDQQLMDQVHEDLDTFVTEKKIGTTMVPRNKSAQEALDDSEWDDIGTQLGMDAPLSEKERQMLQEAFGYDADDPRYASEEEFTAFMESDCSNWHQWRQRKRDAAEAMAVMG
jgi:hypothetical protein